MSDHLAKFPVSIEIPVRWGDMDAFQHVNNTVYFRYFETARVGYLERLGVTVDASGNKVGVILAAINCRFRIPMTYPDTAVAGARITQMGEDRFVMEHRLVSKRHQAVAAEGNATIVAFDYATGCKAALPDELRRLAVELEMSVGNTIAPYERQSRGVSS